MNMEGKVWLLVKKYQLPKTDRKTYAFPKEQNYGASRSSNFSPIHAITLMPTLKAYLVFSPTNWKKEYITLSGVYIGVPVVIRVHQTR
jgi:hypothetical protein